MRTYNVIVSGTVLWLLASAGATNSRVPAVFAASLTLGALVLVRVARRRREKA